MSEGLQEDFPPTERWSDRPMRRLPLIGCLVGTLLLMVIGIIVAAHHGFFMQGDR